MFYPATQLHIIVEKFIQPEVEQILRDHQVTGYSVFAGGGRGSHGVHSVDAASLIREFTIVKIETVIGKRERAEAIAEEIERELFEFNEGVLWLSNVEILRQSKFQPNE